MNDEGIRETREALTSDDIVLALALFTIEIVDRFSADEGFQGFMDMLHALHLNGEVVEQFLTLSNVVAPLTDHLVACFAPVNAFDYLLPLVETRLQLIKDHIQELLSVLLESHVYRFALVVLEGETETEGIVIWSV